MPKLVINKQNQATVTIPQDLLQALNWQKGEHLLVSKSPGQKHLIIENISKKI